MQIAFYKASGTWADKLIRLVTCQKYSHCELVIDGLCYSSSMRDNGVRMKYINLDPKSWDVYELPQYYDQALALTWFIKHVGKKYDMLGAITSVLPFNINIPNRFFCSEACAEMLGVENAKSIIPKDLLKYTM